MYALCAKPCRRCRAISSVRSPRPNSTKTRLDEVTLDNAGKATLDIESRWAEARSPLQLTVQASLQSLADGRSPAAWSSRSGRPNACRACVACSRARNRQRRSRGIRSAGGDREGHKLAAEDLKVRLVRERRDYYWNYSQSDGWSYNYNEIPHPERGDRQREGWRHRQLNFQVEWGPYRVEVEDPQTGLVSSVRFWAGYRAQDNAEGGAVRPDQSSWPWTNRPMPTGPPPRSRSPHLLPAAVI